MFFSIANADLLVKRQGEGYMFSFVENGVQSCWGMPDLVDLNYFDPNWLKVTDTALRYGWPMMTDPAMIAECAAVKTYRTIGGTLYQVTFSLTLAPIAAIPAGIPCGDKVAFFEGLRSATYNGQTGIALCS